MIETDGGNIVDGELYANQHKDVADALELAIAALRAGGKDMNVSTMSDGQPLTLEQLRGMVGKPAFLPEVNCNVLIARNEGVPLFTFSDGSQVSAVDWYEEVGEAYAYQPAHIDREAWTAEWEEDGECEHKLYRIKDPAKWKKYKCSKCGYKAGRRSGQKFCPNCGRAMTSEALVELEKRVRGE